jgi:hypothetical protein
VANDFVISGTGQVIRPGDRVVVRHTTWSEYCGPGVMVEVFSEEVAIVRFDHRLGENLPTVVTRLMREDDEERVRDRPLWCWC